MVESLKMRYTIKVERLKMRYSYNKMTYSIKVERLKMRYSYNKIFCHRQISLLQVLRLTKQEIKKDTIFKEKTMYSRMKSLEI